MSRVFIGGAAHAVTGSGEVEQAMAQVIDQCGMGAVQAIMTLTGETQPNCTGGLLQYAMAAVIGLAPVEGEAFVRALLRATAESMRTRKEPPERMVDSVMRAQRAWLDAADRNVETWGEQHAAGGKVQ